MGQDEVDTNTFNYLEKIINFLLEMSTNQITNQELKKLGIKLVQFREFEKNQNYADMIFSQSFRQLLELISAYRNYLFFE